MKTIKSFWWTLAWVVAAASAFHLAYAVPHGAYFTVLYLFALMRLAEADTWRKAFYAGLAVGLLIASVRLAFFWNVFGAGALALWLVFAFWIGLFVVLARLCLVRLNSVWRWALPPIIWCGLEYFRSELYYLRFSWLSPGFAFGLDPADVPARYLGVYGMGFLLMGVACGAAFLWTKSKRAGIALLVLGPASLLAWARISARVPDASPQTVVHVAGVQMEFPTEQEVLLRLNALVRAHPEAELLVLCEYTFAEPVPERVKQWCREHQRYLIVGGKDPVRRDQFYDTGFVVSPAGEIVFRQAKSVPIQFFKDGLPAATQSVWQSPWGKIGICICYDLSYSRVTDRLVKSGVQALIVPTMDVADWGMAQHELHARVAPLRASEYRIPICRVASSGISQLVDKTGTVKAQAPCPGEGAIISGVLEMGNPGTRPLDRWFAPAAAMATAFVTLGLIVWRRPSGKAPGWHKPERVADEVSGFMA